MNTVKIWHNPTGFVWELVEEYKSSQTIEDIAQEFKLLSHHDVRISKGVIYVGESLKVNVK